MCFSTPAFLRAAAAGLCGTLVAVAVSTAPTEPPFTMAVEAQTGVARSRATFTSPEWDFLLSLSAVLQKGDTQKDLQSMTDRLAALAAQKDQLKSKIVQQRAALQRACARPDNAAPCDRLAADMSMFGRAHAEPLRDYSRHVDKGPIQRDHLAALMGSMARGGADGMAIAGRIAELIGKRAASSSDREGGHGTRPPND